MTGPVGRPGDVRRAELAAGLAAVQQRVAAACARAGRPRADVVLVAVTKTWPASDVALLSELGVTEVGENKDQEASVKAAALAHLPLRWHFVGRVQTGKARSVASYSDLVHSVDRPRLATALAAAAERAGRRLDVLLQVSLDGDPSRGGSLPADLPRLAELVAGRPGLRLAGVMAVAPLDEAPAAAFARLRLLSDILQRDHAGAAVISAGMSNDLEPAILAGATHVRVGTALLGHRTPVLR